MERNCTRRCTLILFYRIKSSFSFFSIQCIAYFHRVERSLKDGYHLKTNIEKKKKKNNLHFLSKEKNKYRKVCNAQQLFPFEAKFRKRPHCRPFFSSPTSLSILYPLPFLPFFFFSFFFVHRKNSSSSTENQCVTPRIPWLSRAIVDHGS